MFGDSKNYFNVIRDKSRIRQILDDSMFGRFSMEFIPGIFIRGGSMWNNWKVTPGGLHVIGSRPFAAFTTDEEKTYQLTNSDSGYAREIGAVNLSDIEYIELL